MYARLPSITPVVVDTDALSVSRCNKMIYSACIVLLVVCDGTRADTVFCFVPSTIPHCPVLLFIIYKYTSELKQSFLVIVQTRNINIGGQKVHVVIVRLHTGVTF